VRSPDTVLAATLLVVFVAMVATSNGYPPAARLVPMLVGIPAIVLAAYQVWRERAAIPCVGVGQTTERSRKDPIDASTIAWFVTFALIVLVGGFTVGGPIAVIVSQRMWLKESEADMKGLNGEDPYSVATVPWTQFFSPEKGLALHTAYWHDQFGTRRSHGCVNLAPRDARWLYFWSDPQVPPGWTMAAGVVEAPGSIVRIRTKEDPAPEAKGYAKKVLEARQQNAPVK